MILELLTLALVAAWEVPCIDCSEFADVVPAKLASVGQENRATRAIAKIGLRMT